MNSHHAFGYILRKVRSTMGFELHLMKVWCILNVRYSHLVFDYILWKVMSTMDNGFVSYI